MPHEPRNDENEPEQKPKGPGKRGGSKPGRTRAAAAIVVADRDARRRGPPPGDVHEGEFTDARPRPSEAPTDADRARELVAKVRARGGRPPELTRDLIERVAERVLRGTSPELALKAEGFVRSTYFDWRAKAKADLAKDPPEVSLYVEFSDVVDAASGQFGQDAVDWLWENRNTPAGKLSASNVTFLLACRHREDYGRQQKVELTGKEGGPVEVVDARAEAFQRVASAVGADASLFLAEMKRWPSSVEEVEAWRSRRAQATAATEPPPPGDAPPTGT